MGAKMGRQYFAGVLSCQLFRENCPVAFLAFQPVPGCSGAGAGCVQLHNEDRLFAGQEKSHGNETEHPVSAQEAAGPHYNTYGQRE